jgi:hypothetical protein
LPSIEFVAAEIGDKLKLVVLEVLVLFGNLTSTDCGTSALPALSVIEEFPEPAFQVHGPRELH